eukprot:gnl/Hemi2/14136_TR4799_c0_g1_i1.p1 gnl/Hemi2/14136_TR4799_c0_g1~~gnl/Hemi2/14136_TR4799_c0_g1_i1.p1  ORF type:complete len:416 (+),score=110.82 gnl/Hemi2/14136_TR4799_c0_g1_i1:224-1471(+)
MLSVILSPFNNGAYDANNGGKYLSLACLERRRLKEACKLHLGEMSQAMQECDIAIHHGKTHLPPEIEAEWYQEQQRSLEQCRTRINKLRLEGDEFYVLRKSQHLGILSERILEITPFSVINLYTLKPQVPLVVADSRGLRHSFHISDVKEMTWGDEVRALRGLRLKVSEDDFLYYSHEAEELLEVLSSHLTRHKKARIMQVQSLQLVYRTKQQAFNAQSAADVALLLRLWVGVFPNSPQVGPVSPEWTKMGFQGNSPATDFRGMGILGLENLIYFAEFYPNIVRELVSKQELREYPFAAAGINLTSLVLRILEMNDDSLVLHPSSRTWETPLFLFLCRLYDADGGLRNAFQEFYCVIFQLLDRVWVHMQAHYFDFPKVIESVKKRAAHALALKPATLEALYRLMCEGDNAGEPPV